MHKLVQLVSFVSVYSEYTSPRLTISVEFPVVRCPITQNDALLYLRAEQPINGLYLALRPLYDTNGKTSVSYTHLTLPTNREV